MKTAGMITNTIHKTEVIERREEVKGTMLAVVNVNLLALKAVVAVVYVTINYGSNTHPI